MNIATLKDRLNDYEKLMRLDKPVGTLLLLWPTLWALWIATQGHPPWLLVWIFVLGTLLMRSAGCVINDWADRDVDPHVARTKDRPLAAGRVSPREALVLAAILTLCAGLLILPIWQAVWSLALVAVFLATSYPFTKRFFAIPQAYLGIAFGFGIPMAFAAATGRVPSLGWAILIANIFWAVAYDTEYAMVDREDDLKIGIKTAAITFGSFDVAAVMLCYLLTLLILAMVGEALHFSLLYSLGLVAATLIAVYHFFLIRDRDRMQCFKAFHHNNWFGAVIFAGIVAELNLKPLLL
ncbi:4-hydroxybenzoate polyprenyltransferase [Rugosibacter aromaticivorans]|uniref:4-hydroxybenzoate octaprenyltransferase n=1 Tax=Rugosibacter aromaticivorans TaxID=1565605 RepID=A0A0C5J9Q9_9PROT|nr:4-hydroxybenzoate octaprenyltransferase [Rugosibacter aromaticivorans]AJP48498.1 4-hydroxybenzoate polyprenyltransferase [Rugosibacter aromaticivorans]TBR15379.1 MAG: 4-hydroxybenzoate octaprenyltransferase [Rugosibacter sp.]